MVGRFRVARLGRRVDAGWLVVDAQQPWLDLHDTSPLDNLNAASIRYSIALGPGKGNRTLTINNPAFFRPYQPIKTLTSVQNGFSLNAAVACLAHQRDSLERLCRYVSRPAICLDRLTSRADGQVQYQLDITICPRCGGRLRVIADITDPTTIEKILNHVARAPPGNEQTLLPG